MNFDMLVGCDVYFYVICDVGGEKVYIFWFKLYVNKGFRIGDIVGCFISFFCCLLLEDKLVFDFVCIK